MRINRLQTGGGLGTIFAVLTAALAAPAYAEQEADFEKLLADKAGAIVTIKYVLKTKGQWGDSEVERETSGVVIAADGLLLCSDSQFGGGPWLRRSGGSATPTDIKVLIGDDTEGLDAKVIARDSELDLTWLRIEEPGDKVFQCISMERAATPEIGQRVYSVHRLPKYFDRVPVVREARLGGVVRKPRKLFVPSGGSGALGLPVYNAEGKVIGVSVSQMPDPDEMQGPGGFAGRSGLILPAEEVVKATRRALESARDEEEDEEEEEEGDSDDEE